MLGRYRRCCGRERRRCSGRRRRRRRRHLNVDLAMRGRGEDTSGHGAVDGQGLVS